MADRADRLYGIDPGEDTVVINPVVESFDDVTLTHVVPIVGRPLVGGQRDRV